MVGVKIKIRKREREMEATDKQETDKGAEKTSGRIAGWTMIEKRKKRRENKMAEDTGWKKSLCFSIERVRSRPGESQKTFEDSTQVTEGHKKRGEGVGKKR